LQERYILHTNLTTIPSRETYDLVIIDGGANIGDCGYVGMTEMIFKNIETPRIYFEGVRRGQRKIVRKLLRDKLFWVSIMRIPFQFCGGSYYKGGTIMTCVKSHSKFRCWRKYFMNEVYEAQSLEPVFGRIKSPL
jgi:hypothetical protein